MPRQLLLFNKPFQVLTQFTSSDGKATLADFVSAPRMYPAGRLDYDSEGLVLLTDWPALQTKISHPQWKAPKTYLAQVEGVPTDNALDALRRGIELNDGLTLPAEAALIEEPQWLWPRTPPIRFRKAIPTSWVKLTIREGRNRQVRRMTAAIGHPTLRLLRWSVGPWTLEGLQPGESRAVPETEIVKFMAATGAVGRPAGRTSVRQQRRNHPRRRPE
jgi:23S rRNA pseudouridine2457 synthase